MDKLRLILFVTGKSRRSEVAVQSVRRFCDGLPEGDYELRVFDVLDCPDEAEEYRVLATPTLIKLFPDPPKRIIGALLDPDFLRTSLEIEGISHSPTEGA